MTEALLTAVGPNPTPADLRALSAAALEIAQTLQIALDDRALPDDWVAESKVVRTA